MNEKDLGFEKLAANFLNVRTGVDAAKTTYAVVRNGTRRAEEHIAAEYARFFDHIYFIAEGRPGQTLVRGHGALACLTQIADTFTQRP